MVEPSRYFLPLYVNHTLSNCVYQMGKIESKSLVTRYVRGAARARHGMCELFLTSGCLLINQNVGVCLDALMTCRAVTALKIPTVLRVFSGS